MAITIRTGKSISLQDILETIPFAEKYFGAESDPAQLQPTLAKCKWILKNIPECITVIRDGPTLVGFIFTFPTSRESMRSFLSHRLSENELFNETQKKFGREPLSSFYLCSALILPKYRRRGIALGSVERSIRAWTKRTRTKPMLFVDPFSREGRKVSRVLASRMKLPLKMRPKVTARARNKPTISRRPRQR